MNINNKCDVSKIEIPSWDGFFYGISPWVIHPPRLRQLRQRQDWAYYLRIDPKDSAMLWLVKAMMETELPKPWTCYKASGDSEEIRRKPCVSRGFWMGLVFRFLDF